MNATIVEALRDREDTPRGFKRFGMQFTVQLTASYAHDSPLATTPNTKITASVSDISVSGLSFRSMVDFPVNAVLLVDIGIGAYVFCIPVIIHRCSPVRRQNRTVYACGVEFIKCEATAKFIPIIGRMLAAPALIKKRMEEASVVGEPVEVPFVPSAIVSEAHEGSEAEHVAEESDFTVNIETETELNGEEEPLPVEASEPLLKAA